MSRIIDLTALDSLSSADNLPVYSSANGDARRASLSTLMDYVNDNVSTGGANFDTQYSTPIAGGTVTCASTAEDADGSENIRLIITPAGALATLTIKTPVSTGLVDKQQVLVTCTQAVTTLTLNANGATAIVGGPTALTANAYFALMYDEVSGNWYRVG